MQGERHDYRKWHVHFLSYFPSAETPIVLTFLKIMHYENEIFIHPVQCHVFLYALILHLELIIDGTLLPGD